MRRILIDRARDKGRLKRGGGKARIDLDSLQLAVDCPSDELLAVDEAIEHLCAEDPRSAKLVKLRFFAEQGAWDNPSRHPIHVWDGTPLAEEGTADIDAGEL